MIESYTLVLRIAKNGDHCIALLRGYVVCLAGFRYILEYVAYYVTYIILPARQGSKQPSWAHFHSDSATGRKTV